MIFLKKIAALLFAMCALPLLLVTALAFCTFAWFVLLLLILTGFFYHLIGGKL